MVGSSAYSLWSRRHGTKTASALGALLTVLSLAQTAAGQATITLGTSIAEAGTSVSHILSPSWFGIGIEPAHAFAYLGTDSPNQFSLTMLDLLTNYTGKPPHIRIGGNTLDNAVYNSTYEGYYFQANPDTTGPTDISYFGPNLFKVVNYLPKGSPITYSMGLAYQGSDAVSQNVQVAQDLIAALTNTNLSSLEIGNEPDLYVQNQYREAGWGVTQYGNEWIARAQAIYTQVLKPKGISQTFFEAACTATTAANRGFRIEDLVSTGVATDNGIWLAGWNQHDYYYYVNVSTYQLTISDLMNLQSTYGQFKEWAAQVGQANVTGKPYYLREMGSVGPGGIKGISNTFSNAIWTLNFFLYASTLGIESVELHCLQDSYTAPWHPIADATGPQMVRPTFYAFAAMAQINGAGCQTQIASLDLSNIPNGYSNNFAAYSVYNAGSLQSIVVINSQVVYAGNQASTQQVVLTLDQSMVGKTFYISLMSNEGADSTQNTTWNGLSYERSGNGTPTKTGETIQKVTVGSDRTLTLNVRDTQAVVANLGSQIGTENNVVDAKACNTLTAKQTTHGGDNTFKATSGFASDLPLSLAAIIGIAAGGGTAILLLLALCIFCCVRRARRKRRQRAQESAALLTSELKGGKKNAYRSVPYNDTNSQDSSEDIFMAPMRKGRTHTPRDSYGSFDPSLAGSPMIPGTPKQTYESYGTPSSSPREMTALVSALSRQHRADYSDQSPNQQSNRSNANRESQLRSVSNATATSAGMAGLGANAAHVRYQQQQSMSDPRRHTADGRPRGPVGPRGPPPTHYPNVRRNSFSGGGRSRSPAAPQSRPASHSAHGHSSGNIPRYRLEDAPPVPSLPQGTMQGSEQPRYQASQYNAMLAPPPPPPQQQQQQLPQRLGRPIRLSHDGRTANAAQPSYPSRARPASHQGHSYGR